MRMTGFGALRSFSYCSLTDVGLFVSAPMVAGCPRGRSVGLAWASARASGTRGQPVLGSWCGCAAAFGAALRAPPAASARAAPSSEGCLPLPRDVLALDGSAGKPDTDKTPHVDRARPA